MSKTIYRDSKLVWPVCDRFGKSKLSDEQAKGKANQSQLYLQIVNYKAHEQFEPPTIRTFLRSIGKRSSRTRRLTLLAL